MVRDLRSICRNSEEVDGLMRTLLGRLVEETRLFL